VEHFLAHFLVRDGKLGLLDDEAVSGVPGDDARKPARLAGFAAAPGDRAGGFLVHEIAKVACGVLMSRCLRNPYFSRNVAVLTVVAQDHADRNPRRWPLVAPSPFAPASVLSADGLLLQPKTPARTRSTALSKNSSFATLQGDNGRAVRSEVTAFLRSFAVGQQDESLERRVAATKWTGFPLRIRGFTVRLDTKSPETELRAAASVWAPQVRSPRGRHHRSR